MRRNAVRLTADGRPVSWLGANFWSRTGGPLMWRNYDPEVVRGELRVLREHGLSVTRSFFYWPDFMPAPITSTRTWRPGSPAFSTFMPRRA